MKSHEPENKQQTKQIKKEERKIIIIMIIVIRNLHSSSAGHFQHEIEKKSRNKMKNDGGDFKKS
mgnify:CR=1 FL=1